MQDDLEAQLSELTPDQLARFERLLAEYEVSARSAEGPAPGTATDPAPLSYQQERIWYLSQLEDTGGLFNIVIALDVTGEVDPLALQRALTELVRRHDVLRSAVVQRGGVPGQRTLPLGRGVVLDCVDLTTLTAAAAEAELDRLTAAAKAAPFDLAAGMLLRACLVSVAGARSTLLLTVHHIAFDGWSAAVFARDLREAYAGFVSGEGGSESVPVLRYADFAAWQRSVGAGSDADVEFWRAGLAGAPHTTTFPGDRRRPARQSFRGDTVVFAVPPEVVSGLQRLARSRRATLFMVLHASLAVLLRRHGAGADTVIGAPIANRTRPGLEDLVGCFINLLPLRLGVEDGEGFADLVGRARDVCLDAYAHQDLPFERLLRDADVVHDAAQSPLFQVMLVLHNQPAHSFTMDRLELEYRDVAGTTSQMDVSFSAVPRDGRLDCAVEFSTDLYDRSSIDGLVEGWLALLSEVAEQPGRSVGELRAVQAVGSRQLVSSWGVGPPVQAVPSLTRLFARVRDGDPALVAVIADGEVWSYERLGRLSDAVAGHLARAELGPGSVVAVVLPRSAPLLASMIAILHNGCAFLAIDPDAPPERIRFMLDDSGASLVLTQEALQERLVGCAVASTTVEAAVGSAADPPPPAQLQPDDLAYLTYTSGSTGTPKAVLATVASLGNRLAWGWAAYPFARDEVCVQKTSVAFVDVVAECLSGLLVGVPTVVVDAADATRVDHLVAVLAKHRVTRVVVVPSLLRAMLGLPGLADLLPGLRLVTTSGEPLDRALLAEFFRCLPRARLVNLYGTSEVGADVTVWECSAGETGPVPIGRPLPGATLRVLDDRMRPLPVAVPGELFVGGRSLARGYAGRGGLTAARFLPDPDDDGRRLYRTGDRVRWRPDGVLEFVGRSDDQVKIRGSRVEPGEVEAVLHGVDGVDGCAVVAQRYGPGDSRLVAFVVLGPGSALDPRRLRDLARAHLPETMIPSVFAVVDRIPMTMGGKIDRFALSQVRVDPAPPGPSTPRTATERIVADVWRDVLGRTRVGLEESFFDIGGHSLLVAVIAARLSADLDREVTLRDVFEHPTVAGLSTMLDGRPKTAAVRSVPPAVTLPRFPETDAVTLTASRLDHAIEGGDERPLDACALTYLPGSWLADPTWSEVVHDRELRRPGGMLANIVDTPLGRIGIMVLPLGDAELFLDQSATVERLVVACRRAAALGARAVSLTGMLPSATRYGRALAERLEGVPAPVVTTGHPVTAYAVTSSAVMALERLGRRLSDERVCFVGLGSIGSASLRLLLDMGEPPAELVLCDLFNRERDLATIAEQVRDEFGYRGELRRLSSHGELPEQAYRATTIVGATSMPDVVDVGRVRPGTLVLDDSYPHCFRTERALARMADAGDALFIEAGLLRAPVDLVERRYLPEWMSGLPGVRDARRRQPAEMMGCALAAGLQARVDDLAPTLAIPDRDVVRQHRALLADLGFVAADPQCAGSPIPADVVRRTGRSRIP